MRAFIPAVLLLANMIWMPAAHAQLGFLIDKLKGNGPVAELTETTSKIKQLRAEGQFAEAISLAEKLVADEAKRGGNSFFSGGMVMSVGTTKKLLAELYGEAGDVERAISLFEEALKDSEQDKSLFNMMARQPHIARLNMMSDQMTLADLYLKAKRFDVAERILLNALKIVEAGGSDTELEQLTLYDKLGSVAIQSKDLPKAELYLLAALQRAKAIAVKSRNDAPGQGIAGLTNAASFLGGAFGQLAELSQGLKQNYQVLGQPSPFAGANLETALASPDGVELGDRTPHCATINKLAAVYSLTGKGGELKKLYDNEFEPYVSERNRAARKFNELAGNRGMGVAQLGIEKSEFAFAQRFAAIGLMDEAESALSAALRLNDDRLREWYAASQTAQSSSGSHDMRRKYVHARLLMALAHPSRNHAGLIEALGSAKGMKADYVRVQTRSMAKLSPKMRAALTDPFDMAAITKYLYADPDPREMQRRANELNARGSSQADQRLREEGKKIVQPLMLAEFEAEGLVYGAVTAAKIRKRLPNGAAYGEFVKLLKPDETGNRPDSYHYALVALLPNKDSVEVHDLGPANEIEVLTSRYGSEMNSVRMTGRAPDIERLKRLGQELYTRLLAPVLKTGGRYTALVICPDGELNLLPFEAFVDNTGNFLISKMDIRYVASARELLNRRPRVATDLTLAVFADPDYDSIAEQAPTDSSAAANTKKRAQLRSATGRALRDEKFDALPETRIEAQRVEAAIKKVFGGNTKVLLGRDANVKNFVGVKSPRFLHVATHGFFLQAPPTVLAKKGDVELQYVDPDEYSGLVLAGANQGLKTGSEAGIVLSNRLSAMDLDDTEMVVLSACSTGVGVVSTGEGVFGLKRAIQIAGARNSITSLWNVPTDETATLMSNFYEYFASEKDAAIALRNAKLSLMKTQPNPFFWAPFVLSGTSATP